MNEKSLIFVPKIYFLSETVRPGPTVTLLTHYISEPTISMDFKFSHIFCIPFKIVVSIFQQFFSINVKMVALLVNIDLRIFFDIFSLITQKPLRFLEFSLLHVKDR